ISGSKSSRAALFNKPTSSSNSVANTEEGNLIDGALEKKQKNGITMYLFSASYLNGTSSEGPEASLRCCK
uniref:Uncharacterized protein n=1 Tax=Junco hyemalis TaxID=40217 RepID=A0A8C5NSD7_JUNHY